MEVTSTPEDPTAVTAATKLVGGSVIPPSPGYQRTSLAEAGSAIQSARMGVMGCTWAGRESDSLAEAIHMR